VAAGGSEEMVEQSLKRSGGPLKWVGGVLPTLGAGKGGSMVERSSCNAKVIQFPGYSSVDECVNCVY